MTPTIRHTRGLLAVAGLLVGFISISVLMWVWQYRFFDQGMAPWVFVVAFLVDDLRYYWYHRIAHRVRWVWAEHVNHHSSQHYNLSTALRQSWTGHLTGMVILQAPLVLLGFHPALIAFVYGFNLLWLANVHGVNVQLPRPASPDRDKIVGSGRFAAACVHQPPLGQVLSTKFQPQPAVRARN